MKKFLCAAILLMAAAGGARAQDIQWGGAFNFGYSDGNYGSAINTDVEMALPTLIAKTGNFQLSASLPYMRLSGRGLVVFDAVGNPILINRRSTLAPSERTGFGDLNLSASYAIPAGILDDFAVKLTGRLKLPTAPTRKRLGTGETDVGMNVDVSRRFGEWQPFVTVGYLISGQPQGFSLNNTLSVSTGTSFELTSDLVAIASYDYDSASSPLVSTSQDLFGSVSWLVNDEMTLTAYATKGLNDGSPDTGAGLIITYGFN